MIEAQLDRSKRNDGVHLKELLRTSNGDATIEILKECVKSTRVAQAVSKNNLNLKILGRNTGLITGELVAAAFGDKSSHYNLVITRSGVLLESCETYGNVFTTLALSDYPRYRALITKFAMQNISKKDRALYVAIMENASLSQLSDERAWQLGIVRTNIMEDLGIPKHDQIRIKGRLSARNRIID